MPFSLIWILDCDVILDCFTKRKILFYFQRRSPGYWDLRPGSSFSVVGEQALHDGFGPMPTWFHSLWIPGLVLLCLPWGLLLQGGGWKEVSQSEGIRRENKKDVLAWLGRTAEQRRLTDFVDSFCLGLII